MTPCPRCQSTDVVVIETPQLQHHAKAECGGCGRWIKWMPKPPQPFRIVTLPEPGYLASIFCEEERFRYISDVRRAMIHRLRKEGKRDEANLVASITDGTWFFANCKRELDDLRWPSLDQIDAKCLPGEVVSYS